MLYTIEYLKVILGKIIDSQTANGHDTTGLAQELATLPHSYDAVAEFSNRLRNLPLRADWKYFEPSDAATIWRECAADRPTGVVGDLSKCDVTGHVKTGVLGAIAGCVLGKPLEVDPTLYEFRDAAKATSEWPLNDYVSTQLLEKLGRRHWSWTTTVKGQISFAAPDDDINYLITGLLVLEEKGINFNHEDLLNIWLYNLPMLYAFGPERTTLVRGALRELASHDIFDPIAEWPDTWNPRNRSCGAVIRVDTYGFAAPGNPALAAKLAMRDASLTHRQTGIYAAMFIAAAIAIAFVAKKPLEMFDVALKFVPRRSRFYEVMADCLAMVKQADDWEKGYDAIHAKYKEFGHCLVFQECGLLINTAKFATDVGDAICKQVAQGCDTDSFGKLAGSLMGAYFGPGHLENRWIEPFNDDLRTTMASFYERSLSKVVQRIADLHLKLKNKSKTSDEIVNGKEITGDVIDRDYGDLH